ncbi:MAG: SatD family protein [Gammaproteobacteria bacterium]
MAPPPKSESWVAVIGDMVHSRALTVPDRAAAQEEFTNLVTLLNQRFRRSIASRFVITLGDEFQGLLSNPEVIPELVWLIETEYREREVRIGVGYGTLHTPIRKVALNIDGPVLHYARAAITVARTKKLLGGVFNGFGPHDDVLTGFAQVLRYVRQHMTAKQRQVLELLRAGHTQHQAAVVLGISKQAVSDHAIAAGGDAYRLAELGWTQALRLATSPDLTRHAGHE